MKLILLGGNSPHNEAWILEVKKAMRPLFSDSEYLQYEHWKTTKGSIDFKLELKKLKEIANSDGDFVIFAKSAGCILAMKGIDGGSVKPRACIFAGIAVGMGEPLGLNKWLKNYQIPTLFVQQTDDPAIGAVKLRELLEKSGVKNFRLSEIPGDDHDYNDLDQIKSLTESFLKLYRIK